MIKITKRATYWILEPVDAIDEELMTAFTVAEALMHSRSLMYRADDTSIITKRFLIGHVLFKFASESVDNVQFSRNFRTFSLVSPSSRRNRNTSKSMT